MKQFVKYLRGNWKYVILSPILMIIDTIGGLVQPYFMAKIIDVGIKNGDMNYIIQTGMIMILFAIIGMAAGFACMFFSAKASYGFSANLRKALMDKVQEFSFANINKFTTSSLVTRLTNDVEVIGQLVQMMLRIVIRAPVMFVGGIVMALILNKQLSVLIVALIPLLLLLIIGILKKTTPYFTKLQTKIDKVNGVIRENLIGARVVKAFVRENQQEKRFETANADLRDISVKSYGMMVLMMPGVTLIMNIAIAAVLWFGAQIAQAGGIEVGSLSSYITYITMTLSSLIMVSMVFMIFSRAKASADRITEVLTTVSDIQDKADCDKTLTVNSGKVEYKINQFTFVDSDEPILHDIDLTISSGETVAIIGSTGTGKSTLVNLIPRFYDVTDGYVKVDDKDVKDYDLTVLRDGIGMVLQENRLFSGTIKENIKWGKKDATDEEIMHACMVAQIHDFIESMPNQYDSMVEQRGTNFSGGQKQRLCIARALVKKPKILILDDSVSALDATTENNLRKSLQEEFSETTIFIITQRINSCKTADRVLVIEDGTISAVGTHEELLKTSKVYKEISDSQQEVITNA